MEAASAAGAVAGPHAGTSRMDRDRERTLVDRARSDAASFAELYDFYLPRIYGFVYRRVQERSVAEDLTATTFQRALEAIRYRNFRNDAFGGWLYRVLSFADQGYGKVLVGMTNAMSITVQ